MAGHPSKSSRLRFAWVLGAAIVIYGILTIILSVHVIDQQSGARTDLYVALETLDQMHHEAMASASTPTERKVIADAWRNERAFAARSPQQAQQIADQLIVSLNQEYPHNSCGQLGPSFVKASALPEEHACMVAVGTQNDQVTVTGYDTQGIAMDNFYEFLYAPTGRSD